MNHTAVSQSGNTLLDKIVDFIIPPYIVLFLNQTLYRNFFIIINYWSFVHLFSGIVFYFFKPSKHSVKNWFIIYFLIHFIFEIVEYILALGGNPLFVEEFIDIIWDMIWGLTGFLLMFLLLKKLYNIKWR